MTRQDTDLCFSKIMHRSFALPIIFAVAAALTNLRCAAVSSNAQVSNGDASSYTYTPQGLSLGADLNGLHARVSSAKPYENSPVEPPAEYIGQCVAKELAASGVAIVSNDSQDVTDVTVQILVSRYVTRQVADYYITSVDGDFQVTANVSGQTGRGQFSLSGRGNGPKEANRDAVNGVVTRILLSEQVAPVLSVAGGGVANALTRQLDNLARRLARELGALGRPPIRVAITNFKGAENTDYSSIFSSSLLEHLPPNHYELYTRTQFDALLREYELQMAGLLDGENVIELGKLKIADIIITGSVLSSGGANIIEVQAVGTGDGRVVASVREVLK